MHLLPFSLSTTHRALLGLMVVVSIFGVLLPNFEAPAMAAHVDEFKTGDHVQFDFLRKTTMGTVTDFTGIDKDLRSTLWRYHPFNGSLVSVGDNRFWFNSIRKLTPLNLPHQDFSKSTDRLDPEQLLVLKKGMRVSIELQLPFDDAKENKILNYLMMQLNELGVEVGARADLTLTATVK